MNLDFSGAPVDAPTQFVDDTDDLRHFLNDTLESWLPRVLPGGRVFKQEFIAGSVRGEEGQSLRIRLNGDRRGLWQDRATGESGDPFALLQTALGLDFASAASLVREMRGTGLQQRQQPKKTSAPMKPVDQSWKVREVLNACGPAGEVVKSYLFMTRGLSITDLSPDILEATSLHHYQSSSWHPAMVAVVRGIDDKVVGVHRTYLTADGRKSSVEPNKMMLSVHEGAMAGGAVRLGMTAMSEVSEVIGVSEGIETGLAAMEMFRVPVWATLSTSGLRTVVIPDHIKHILIFADNDPPIDRPGTPLHGKRPGTIAAEALADRLVQEGKTATIVYPKPGYKDFNDELMGKSTKD